MYIFPYFTSKFYELVVNFNHSELDLITSICAYLGMTGFGTYNKSHGPARENTDHPDFHYATQDFGFCATLRNGFFGTLHTYLKVESNLYDH